MTYRIHRAALTLLALSALAACADSATSPRARTPEATLATSSTDIDGSMLATIDQVNAALSAEGAPYMLAMAEYITDGSANALGSTVIARSLGNKQLTADFVPLDPRRAWSGPATGPDDDIRWAIDQTGDAVPPLGGLSGAQASGAIRAAMATWDAQTCSNFGLVQNPDGGLDIGLVAFLSGLGGSPFVFADVQHAGFRDINFSGGVLGATYTFVFTAAGVPTDINGDRLADVAFREIYYDPSWNWANGANIDVESVALHEVGHGLSQAHFGNIFIRNSGTFDASPRAVMNAFYQSPLTALLGTDNGGHCSNWANWPQR